MNLAVCFPRRARRSALMGGRLRVFALRAFVPILLALFNSLAVAQSTSSPLVYVTQRAYITQHFFPEYQGLAVYQWPRLDLVAIHSEVPDHDSLLLSPDGRELYLFSRDQITVLDRASLRVKRTLTRPASVTYWWVTDAKISPARPDMLMTDDGYWFSLSSGQVFKTPTDLAPGFIIIGTQLDDSGERVALHAYRINNDGTYDWRVRLLDLEGRPITTPDLTNVGLAVPLPDHRIAIMRANETVVRIIDQRTQGLVQTLAPPEDYRLFELASDGRGGLLALGHRAIPNNRFAGLLHWPRAQGDAQVLHRFEDQLGHRLRVSGNKVLMHADSGEWCLSGLCSLPRGLIYVHDLSNAEGYRIQDSQYAFGIYDAAPFSPVGVAQPSTVPTMNTWTPAILAGLVMLFAWRTLTRMRDAVPASSRVRHRT